MSVQKPRITIVGLGLIGASMGLALRKAGAASQVVGHDREPSVSSAAKKLGAVDRTDWQLIPACDKADLVVLATPLGAIRETLKFIGPELRAGCVVIDTASAKAPVLEWAAESLPEEVHFVGGNPIVHAAPALSERGGSAAPSDRIGQPAGPGGVQAARADLFDGGLFCLTPSPGADAAAIKLVTDLVALLGAKPLFFDPLEHDGLLAAVEHLPPLLALALWETASGQPTWRELQKVAGAPFETGTDLSAFDPVSQGVLSVANRDNILRWIDEYVARLASLRTLLAEDEGEQLGKRFEAAWSHRLLWLSRRSQGTWQDADPVEMPPKQGVLDSFLGGFLSRRMKRES